MKEEAVALLGRALQASEDNTITMPVKRTLFRRLLSPLVELMDAPSDGVRDAACQTLAHARRFLADDTSYARLVVGTVCDSKKIRIDHAYQCLVSIPLVKKVDRPPKSAAILTSVRAGSCLLWLICFLMLCYPSACYGLECSTKNISCSITVLYLLKYD